MTSSPPVVWPDSTPALFIDGPLAGVEAEVPAHTGQPPFTLHVELDEENAPVTFRPGNEGKPAAGRWVTYLWANSSTQRRGEPATFRETRTGSSGPRAE